MDCQICHTPSDNPDPDYVCESCIQWALWSIEHYCLDCGAEKRVYGNRTPHCPNCHKTALKRYRETAKWRQRHCEQESRRRKRKKIKKKGENNED